MTNPKVFMEITIGGDPAGQITIELYKNTVPRTAENFLKLCENQTGDSFLKCPFHRIIPDFMAQGGDFTRQNGTGGRSIYGAKFDDENFIHKHDGRGILSMANSGKNTNGSQFFLCFKPTSWLNGKHVVFGKVVDGLDVLDKMEAVGSSSGRTSAKVYVSKCGVLP